jgi:hypothetical protein
MTIDFNSEPYFDDFNEEKNYLRILFRPGTAVQARELTQLQTAVQNQIGRFGQSIFEDGAVVLNGQTHVTDLNWVEIERITSTINLQDRRFVGQSSSARGKIYSVEAINDSTMRVYFRYLSGDFIDRGEDLLISDSLGSVNLSVLNEDRVTGVAKGFSVEDSIFFIKTERDVETPDFAFEPEIGSNDTEGTTQSEVRSFRGGYFVYCDEQRIILFDDTLIDEGSVDPNSVKVGLRVTEDIVTPQDDNSLNDPARGSNNFAAPGADRYTIGLTLEKTPYNPQDETDQNFPTVGDFIELARFENKALIEKIDNTRYSDLETTFARRTFDESGDYTVKPFRIKIKNHVGGDPDKVTVTVNPGKAYIKGYEFETISPVNLDLNRSRDTETRNNITTIADFGEYFVVNNPTGDIFSYNSYDQIDLVQNDSGGPTTIGTARVRSVEPEDDLTARIAVFDVSLDSGFVISDIDTLSSGSWSADLPESRIFTNERKSFIRPLPNKKLDTISVDTYQVYKGFGTGTPLQIDSNNEVTFSEIGSSIIGTNENDYFVIDFATGERIPVLNVSGTVDQRTLELDVNGETSAVVYTFVSVNSPSAMNKQLTTETITVSSSNETISLNRADCFELVSVIATDSSSDPIDNLDVTGLFTFDNGQRDEFYDHGSIELREDAAIDSDYDEFVITFRYFSHTNEGTFFSVDSYNESGIPYENIPTFTSSTGTVYDLSDSLDFRPVRQANSTEFVDSSPAFIDSLIVSDYDYYLARIDKLVITKERKFKIIEGVSAVEPSIPKNDFDAMPIYTLRIPAYTSRAQDVSFSFIENRRYTMRDIGKIDRRVDRVEEFATISNIENIVRNSDFFDAFGNNLFKNAILVDNFKGHSVGDVFSNEYQASIDREKQILRPRHSSQSFDYVLEDGTNSLDNLVKNDDLITLSYQTNLLNEQPYATNSVNVNPYLTFNWEGNLSLTPETDTWIDTTTKPDVVINLNGENDVFTDLVENAGNPAAIGVRWNDWQTVQRGIEVDDNLVTNSITTTSNENDRVLEITNTTTTNEQTVTTEERLERVGLEIAQSSPIANFTDLGNKITDISIDPFVRSRVVYFSAKNMKPNTRLFASFDGVEVTDFVQPAPEITVDTGTPENTQFITSGSKRARVVLRKAQSLFIIYDANSDAFNTSDTIAFEDAEGNSLNGSSTITQINTLPDHTLVSNPDGDVAGSFRIPNNENVRFNTGELPFRIADSFDRFATTAAETRYVAQGLAQETERTIVSTRVSNVSINPITDTDVRETTETQNIVVSQDRSTEDVTPDPGPSTPLLPPVIDSFHPCGGTFRSPGSTPGLTSIETKTYEIGFGPDTGTAGIMYNRTSLPVRYTIVWDGQSYSTGFIGSSDFNEELNALGFPNVSGQGSGEVVEGDFGLSVLVGGQKLLFEKTRETPQRATLIVETPKLGFRSEIADYVIRSICPTADEIPSDLDLTTADLSVTVSGNSTVTTPIREIDPFTGEDASSTSNPRQALPILINTQRSDGRTDTKVELSVSVPTGIPGQASAQIIESENMSPDQLQNIIDQGIEINRSQTTESSFDGDFNFLPGDRRPGMTDLYNILVPPPYEGTSYSFTVDIEANERPFDDPGGAVLNTATTSKTFTVRSSNEIEYNDPVAQSFYVDSEIYSNGVFVNDIDLFFRTKPQDNTPVTVHIRPTVNGYPSSTKILPFSVKTIEASEVVTSDDGSAATNFRFNAPVHLAPGEYSFVVLSASDEYNIFTSRIGEFSLQNQETRVTTQPTLGSMFKSQNASTWTADQEQDIKYRLNQCIFDTASDGTAIFNTSISSENGNVPYDLFFTDGEHLDFAETDIRYEYNVESEGFSKYQLGSNVEMSQTRTLNTADPSSLQFRTVLTTRDRNVSPVIDTSRLSSVLVKNVVNNNSNSEDSVYSGDVASIFATSDLIFVTTTEANPLEVGDRISLRLRINSEFSGSYIVQSVETPTQFTVTREVGTDLIGSQSSQIFQAGAVTRRAQSFARYITRRVNLAEGLESKDLRVQFSSKQPAGTKVIPYFKVSAASDTDFDLNDWVEMSLENQFETRSNTVAENEFVKFQYGPPFETGGVFGNDERYDTFAVKLVLLSEDTTRVPYVKDLKIVSLD